MIRIFVDELGDGHQDLFLKIDGIIVFFKAVDSFYLFEFLEIKKQDLVERNVPSDSRLHYATVELINYWKGKISKTEDVFLPFDFQDEYIGGFKLKRTKLGFVATYGYSTEIHGYEITRSLFEEIVKERQIKFVNETNFECFISFELFDEGLEWSLERLLK